MFLCVCMPWDKKNVKTMTLIKHDGSSNKQFFNGLDKGWHWELTRDKIWVAAISKLLPCIQSNVGGIVVVEFVELDLYQTNCFKNTTPLQRVENDSFYKVLVSYNEVAELPG